LVSTPVNSSASWHIPPTPSFKRKSPASFEESLTRRLAYTFESVGEYSFISSPSLSTPSTPPCNVSNQDIDNHAQTPPQDMPPSLPDQSVETFHGWIRDLHNAGRMSSPLFHHVSKAVDEFKSNQSNS
jgi:hypothetical protein